MIKADISLEVSNPGMVLKALKPDVEETRRFKVNISQKGKALNIHITAQDVTALRAAVNSYLRLVKAAEGVEEE